MPGTKKFSRLLVANRSEIATRVFRSATEQGLQTVAIYANEDRFSMHRFKADEAYLLDTSKGPVGAYLDIDGIVSLAKEKHVDAIHPGYGFLSENPAFARACAENGIVSDIEMIPIASINDAYERMLKSDVKYRFVIDMASLQAA